MSVSVPWFQDAAQLTAHLGAAALAAGIAIAIALVLHLGLFALLAKLARLSTMHGDEAVLARLRQPARWLMVAVALAIAAPAHPLLATIWEHAGKLIMPALLGWIAFALVAGFADGLDERALKHDDANAARSHRTRIRLLSRMIRFLIAFVTVALVLFAIPGVRNIGSTLLASAGLAGLAVGAAAQPALKSLIAGLQIALTEPLRIDDYVVIEGEAGRVEDIRLSYVVIRTGDERRVIVPTAKFLDASFQNWTRVGGGITGSVLLPILPGHPIAPIRAAYERLLAQQPDWDKRTCSLQVAEAKIDAVEIKLVMTADGPASLNRLRNAIREAMLEWLRTEMPAALDSEGSAEHDCSSGEGHAPA